MKWLHRIKISNRRATQRCNVSAFFYAKICSLLARRRSSQPVQRVYWPENVIDWLGKWRPTCVMRHARGQKLQSFRRKWPFYMNLYSMVAMYIIHSSTRYPDPRLTPSRRLVSFKTNLKTTDFKRNSSGITRIYEYTPLNYRFSYGPGDLVIVDFQLF